MHRIRLEHELGDHTEIPTTTPQGPEQIRIVLFVGCHKAPICQHDIGGEQVVDGKTVFARQVTQSTSQSKSTNSVVEMMPLGTARLKACVA